MGHVECSSCLSMMIVDAVAVTVGLSRRRKPLREVVMSQYKNGRSPSDSMLVSKQDTYFLPCTHTDAMSSYLIPARQKAHVSDCITGHARAVIMKLRNFSHATITAPWYVNAFSKGS